MNKQLKISSHVNPFVPCDCSKPPVMEVKQGLAMSPSDISRATSRGYAVSSQIDDSLFYDGDDSPLIDIPIERTRGIDAATVWEAQQSAKKRLISAHLRDKETYD